MIRLKDRIKSVFYRLVRSDAPNNFNSCKTCKKYRKNWAEFVYKNEYLVGYHQVLAEWVIFAEYNVYAKIWVMNGYITDIYKLDEKLWNNINNLCRRCITDYFKTYKELGGYEANEPG